jgi:ABC-type multidrug transport system ATPase subunit
MPLLNLINAGYSYPGTDKWVFRHFNMSIDSGEAIRIAGRNGSGKTTLLKVISGILELKEGEFRKQRETKTAYMDQFSGEMLARDLTIAEQLKTAALNESLLTISIEMLDEFGLGLKDRRGEFVGHLSGGQRQIVALLCTLATGASVLCLDEVTSSMDEHSMHIANRLLLYSKTTSKVTLVLVSHTGTGVETDREFEITLDQMQSGNSEVLAERSSNA